MCVNMPMHSEIPSVGCISRVHMYLEVGGEEVEIGSWIDASTTMNSGGLRACSTGDYQTLQGGI